MNQAVPLLVAIPLAVAFLIPLALRKPVLVDVVSNIALLSLLVLSGFVCGEEIVYHMGDWPTPIGIDLRVDSLAALMLLTVSGLSLTVGVYSASYLDGFTARYRYYSLLLFLVAGLNGVVLAADVFNLYVFMEIATIASYALVAFGGRDTDYEASFKYAMFGSISSSLILLAIGLIYGIAGTLNMSHLASRFADGTATAPLQFALVLFLCGFGVKAAVVPFHAWLPDAYPAAPAPIAALLSGTASKVVGVYVLARLLFNVFGANDELLLILRLLGGVTMVVGGLLALGQWDIKRLFAYSSVGQVGLIVLALGFGTMWGVVGALFHFINHAVFKPLLFLNSGQVEAVANTCDLREMQGRGKTIPVTAVTSLIASLAVAGVPPFSGFWSKLIIVVAAVQADHLGWAVVTVVMSIVTLVYQFKVQKEIFALGADLAGELQRVGRPTDRVAEPVLIAVPMILLAIGCVALPLLAVTGLDHPILVREAAEVLMSGTKIWWGH